MRSKINSLFFINRNQNEQIIEEKLEKEPEFPK